MPSLVPPEIAAGRMAAQPQPVLPAGPWTLRPWTPDDAPAVVDAYRDPAIQQWHARYLTEAEADTWVRSWPGRWAAETGAGWAIETAGRVAGQIGLRRLRLDEGWAEISYWVRPEHRGRGAAPAALEALTGWAFTGLGLNRLVLDHSTRNAASCRVATKAGYAVEGTGRRQYRHPDGWHDMHWHARLNPAC